uniref:Marker of proliferation Ki-67 n=1 Tax=Microcebus murinus TaxID=30608 RepID=A0A8C5Y6C1_MICMU
MGPSRRLITIKRSGVDGPHFPLSLSTCLFGRGIECDIRIQLPVVSKQHCKIETNEQEAILYNFSSTNPTQVNGSAIDKPVQLKHGDVITIIDRSFRYENESCQNGNKSTEFPGKIPEQGPSRRVSRSSFSSDPNKSEGRPLKRRRVSFGGRLRPELFDENLPPNTPLKRGETPTKRKSLVAHTPTVLKKIIKEQPQASGKEESASEIHVKTMAQNVFVRSPASSPRTTPVASAQSRRSCRESSASGGSKSQTDIPKRGGRKSGNLPSKRTSISRSQHGILQMICSKRRSGASEANLIVAKSWADVVKLGVKQTQTKVVKHGPQRLKNKKQRRPKTPKKPVDDVHNQFSTGHANSPCTIIIGKAHTEKVKVPAQPYRMLNNFISNQKLDFKEDLSGLSEMFKTPLKEKSQLMSSSPVTLSSSENLLGKKFQVTNSGEKPLLTTSESFGENVLFCTRNGAKEPDTHSASPALQWRCVKENETLVKTPRNIYKATPVKMKTSDTETEPSKTVSGANRLRRSTELRNLQKLPIESMNEETKTGTVEDIMGKCLRRPPLREKKIEGEMKETERPFETRKEIIESKENSEMMAAGRGSRRSWGHKNEPASNPAGLKRWPKTASMKDMTDTQDLQTPDLTKEPRNEKDKTTKLYQTSLQAEPVNTPTSMNRQLRTSLGKVNVKEELSALGRLSQTPGPTVNTHKEPVPRGTPQQKVDPENSVTGVKRWPRAAKEEVHPLEGLSSFKELFQTPKHSKKPTTEDKTPKIHSKSLQSEPVNIPSTKRWPKTSLGKIATEEELAALRKLSETPGESTYTPNVPAEDKDIKAFKDSAEQKLDPAASVVSSRTRPRAAKKESQTLEDLSGFKELFQTPNHNGNGTTDNKPTNISSTSPQPEPTNAPIGTKRRPKTSLGKMNVEELSASRKLSQTPGEATHTLKVPGEDKGIIAFKETAEQKLGLASSVTGSRKRPESSPASRRPDYPCTSPGPGLVATPVSMKTQPNTSKAMHTPKPPVDGEKGIRAFMGTPKQRHDWQKIQLRHKRRPRTLKEKTCLLKELFQHRTLEIFTTSTQADSSGYLWESGCERRALSSCRRPTTPGQTVHTHKEPVPRGKGTKMLQETPRQKVDPENSVTGVKRWPRAAKEEVHPLEDLSGFKELFQTPKRNDRPTTEGKTARISSKSPQPEPVNTPIGTKRRPKTPLGKMGTEEELAPLRKLSQTPGKSTHPPKVPAENKDVRVFMESVEQKLDPVGSVVSSRKRPRAPKEDTKPLEDLSGFKELFQTPKQNGNATTEDKTTKIPSKYPQPELVSTSTSMKRRPKTPLGKTAIEEDLSALRKLSQTPGESMHTPKETLEHKGIIAFRQSAEQKLYPAASVTGSKKRPRAAEEEAHPLEDLSGFKELFQTPRHSKKATTEDKTTKIPCTSLQAERVNTPICTKRWPKTPLGKMTVEEEPSASRKLLQTPGKKPSQTPGEPRNTLKVPVEDKDIIAFKQSGEQKLGLASSVTGSRRRPSAAEKETRSLEDLAGFKELFQTPGHTEESMTDGKTTTPCTSPMKTQPNTSLRKADVEGEFLQAMHTPKPPVDGEKGIRAFMGTPKQRHDLAEDSTGHKRRPRTLRRANPRRPVWLQRALQNGHTDKQTAQDISGERNSTDRCGPENSVTGVKRWPRAAKEEVHPLEDLSGFKELFQTPKRNDRPTTEGKTARISSKAPQPEPVNTPTSMKRWPKTPLGKTGTEEELAALRLSQTPGEATDTRKVLGEDKGIRAFKESAEQKLDPAASVPGSRKRPRAAKKEAQPLEDLSGLKELFQTPKHNDKPTTEDKTTKIPSKSLQLEPGNTLLATKRRPNRHLGKISTEEELSALRKLSQLPGESTHLPKLPGEVKGIKVFKESAEQKLDPVASVRVSSRRLRAAKGEAQPLEELSHFKKPFQTPGHTEETLTVDKRTKVSCTTLQPEPLDTAISTRRRPKANLRNVSALGKLTETSGESTHMHEVPVGNHKGIKAFKESAEQKLDQAASVTGSRRRPRAAKEKAQPLEDLAGFKKPFPIPSHTEESMTVDKSTKMSCNSPQPEPVDTVVSTRWPKRSLRKVSAMMKVTQASGESTHAHEILVVKDKGINVFKQSAEQKLDLAANITDSRRRPRATKEKAQPLEVLAGFKKPFPAPGHTEESTTSAKTATSPLPEPVDTTASRKRQPKGSLRKVSVLQNLMQTSGETTHTSTEPQGRGKRIRVAKESAKQKLDPAENVYGTKRQPSTAKKEAEALEVLANFKELVPAPGQPGEPRKDAESLKTTPKQPPDSGEPLKTFRRVLRAPKAQSMEDMVGTRDPIKSQSKSNTALTSKRKCGKDDCVLGTKRLRCMTATEGVVEEEPANKKQRTVPREKHSPTELLVVMKKSLRTSAESMEPVGDLNSNNMKTKKKEHEAEGSVTANKGISLRPRRQNKSDVEQQKTEVPIAAEKTKIKRNEKKSVKTSQELETENPGDRAKEPTARGKVSESRSCSRSLRQSKSSQPSAAQEEGAKQGVGTHTQNQREKGVRGNSDFMRLRSRKVQIQPAVNMLGSEPEQRATRAMKRRAENPKEVNIVFIKKMRTRSHRDSEDI